MMELSEKVMLDIGVSEGFVETVVQAIMHSAGTGEVGDGKIFVCPWIRFTGSEPGPGYRSGHASRCGGIGVRGPG